MKKSVSILLLVSLLFQSCVVYQKTSVSFNEAIDNGNVKVVDALGTHKYKSIELSDSIYYGFSKDINNDEKKTPIDTAAITAVYLKDIKKSKKSRTGLYIGLGLGTFCLTWLILWAVSPYGPGS